MQFTLTSPECQYSKEEDVEKVISAAYLYEKQAVLPPYIAYIGGCFVFQPSPIVAVADEMLKVLGVPAPSVHEKLALRVECLNDNADSYDTSAKVR